MYNSWKHILQFIYLFYNIETTKFDMKITNINTVKLLYYITIVFLNYSQLYILDTETFKIVKIIEITGESYEKYPLCILEDSIVVGMNNRELEIII